MKARKRILYFVAVVAILFVACEKEEPLQPDPTPEQESPVFVQNAVTDLDSHRCGWNIRLPALHVL